MKCCAHRARCRGKDVEALHFHRCLRWRPTSEAKAGEKNSQCAAHAQNKHNCAGGFSACAFYLVHEGNCKAKQGNVDQTPHMQNQSKRTSSHVGRNDRNEALILSPEKAQKWTRELLNLINKTRTSRKLHQVRLSGTLCRIAKLHNEYQASAGKISHSGREGSSLLERMQRGGYPLKVGAENVASGQRNPAHVHNSFMNSPGHARNVLKEDVDDIGLHVTLGRDGRLYWTEVFGRKKESHV